MREDHEHQKETRTAHAIRISADRHRLAPALTLSPFVGVATVGGDWRPPHPTIPLQGGGTARSASRPG
jgi:hypothetical protein